MSRSSYTEYVPERGKDPTRILERRESPRTTLNTRTGKRIGSGLAWCGHFCGQFGCREQSPVFCGQAPPPRFDIRNSNLEICEHSSFTICKALDRDHANTRLRELLDSQRAQPRLHKRMKRHLADTTRPRGKPGVNEYKMNQADSAEKPPVFTGGFKPIKSAQKKSPQDEPYAICLQCP